MERKTVLLTLAGLVSGALIALFSFGGGSHGPGAPVVTTTGQALIGGPFTLTDHTGRRVTEKDYAGQYMLVFFGFTHCPDICPSSLQVLSAALDKLGAKADKVTPLFITIDAERDTPEKLNAYVSSFHPRLTGLSGSEEEVAAAAKAYRIYANKVTDEQSPGSYSYDHSTIFYLMDPSGAFVAPIPHTTDVEDMRAALDKAIR
jgi:protein SCO1